MRINHGRLHVLVTEKLGAQIRELRLPIASPFGKDGATGILRATPESPRIALFDKGE